MKTYEIYTSPIGGIEAVKKGWSWPGFFFSWIWAFVKKLHGLGAGILIVGLILHIASPPLGLVFDIIIGIWLGSSGNDMRAANLKKRGFKFADFISAQSPEGAMASFIQEKKSQKQEAATEAHTDNAPVSQPMDNTSNLITCPDCNKAVSRKAVSCPNCGCPITP
jgi:hypothetical protein